MVNSSLFGLSREVSDLNQALALLGTKPLKLLVLGFSLPPGFFAGLTADMLGDYWRHTLTKAVAAREISESVWRQPGDEAFIAGLLQDLGMLVLIQDLGPPYLEFLDKVRQHGAELSALEIASLGFDHTQLSSRLLAHWGLPKTLTEAVRCEPSEHSLAPPSADPPRLRQILSLAQHMAAWLVDGRSEALEGLLRGAAQHHGLSPKQLEDIVASLEEKVRQLADVLSLKLPEGREYRDVLSEAHERLAETAAEAAGELLRHRHGRSPDASDPSLLDHVRALDEAARRVSQRGSTVPALGAAMAVGECDSLASLSREPSTVVHSVAVRPADVTSVVVQPAAAQPAGARASAAILTTEVDPGVLGQLAAAVITCRQLRCALSLLMVDFNDVDDLLLTRGVDGFGHLRRFLGSACRSLDHPRMVCLPQGDAGFVLILPDCDRSSAVHLGNLLIDRMKRLTAIGDRGHRATLSLSVGVATVSLPPKNFPAGDLLAAADRCLYGSRSSGGTVVKSIEIY